MAATLKKQIYLTDDECRLLVGVLNCFAKKATARSGYDETHDVACNFTVISILQLLDRLK